MPSPGDLYVGGIKPVVSSALTSAFQLSAKGPGVLYDLTALNFNATARMVLLLDQVPSPANASGTSVSPIWFYPIAGLATTPGPVGLGYFVPPIQFVNGLWVILSTVLTTPYTATTSTTADGAFSALVQTS